MTNKVYEILILDGVEDYLTDLAKKYKRNLMLSGFILVSLYFLNGQGINIELTSAFGFGFKSKESNIGIGIDLLAGLLIIVCIYEMMMLSIYKQQCDSHYFGRQISKNNKDGESEDLNYYKRKFTLISQVKNLKSDTNSIVESYLKLEKDRNSRFDSLIDPIEFEKICNFKLNEINKKNYTRNKDLITNLTHEILHNIELRTKGGRTLNDAQKNYLEGVIKNKLIEIQITPKTTYEEIKDNFFRVYFELYKSENELIEKNEEWKIYIEEQLQETINLHKRVIDKLEKVRAPSKLIVLMEIQLPLVWGVVSIILGLKIIFC
ncbi:hypothetical protein [Vibrio owensii]|uniref:hypothetical protein n=1 Tax=Vibrio owensii TaxID=696485 RepID=UPI0038CE0856